MPSDVGAPSDQAARRGSNRPLLVGRHAEGRRAGTSRRAPPPRRDLPTPIPRLDPAPRALSVDRDRRQSGARAGAATLLLAGPQPFQLGTDAAEGGECVEGTLYVAIAIHQAADQHLQDGGLLGGQDGALDEHLAQRSAAGRQPALPSPRLHVIEPQMRGTKPRWMAMALEQQFRDQAHDPRPRRQPSLGDADRSGSDDVQGTTRTGRGARGPGALARPYGITPDPPGPWPTFYLDGRDIDVPRHPSIKPSPSRDGRPVGMRPVSAERHSIKRFLLGSDTGTIQPESR